MKKVLITGGAGFIGSNLCNTFVDKYDITAIDNLFLGSQENFREFFFTQGKFIEGDAAQIQDLEKTGNEFDVLIHLAGSSSSPMFEGDRIAEAYTNSIESFIVSVRYALKCGAKKVIYASTSSLYGNHDQPLTEDLSIAPPNHYAVTKYMYEQMSENFSQEFPDVNFIGLRFMSVYGPNEESKGQYANMISQFAWDAARNLPSVIYGDGSQERDFTNVLDILQAIEKIIEYPDFIGAEVYNVGTGKTTSFDDVILHLAGHFPGMPKSTYIKNPVKNYIRTQHADISKISRKFGYAPSVALQEGIEQLLGFLDIRRIRETSSEKIRKKI